MAWIESHTVLLRHRKLLELAKELRLKPVYVLGHLHALWHAALEQQEDGDLSSWSDDLIAEVSCYQGDASQYVSLLRLHKWLDGNLIHDWLDYAGKYLSAKYRSSNPGKLKKILAKHKSVKSPTKVGRSPIGLGKVGKVPKSSEGEVGEPKFPEWLNSESWTRFCEHRDRMFKEGTGKKLTPYATEKALAKLGRLRDLGHDPTVVIEQSIEGPWQGFFPIREIGPIKKDPTKSTK